MVAVKETNPYESPSVGETHQAQEQSSRLRLVLVVALTGLGCLLAFAVGRWVSIPLDSVWPSVLAAALLPAVGSFAGGIRRPSQLAKIVAYGFFGWILCYELRPMVSGRIDPSQPSIHMIAHFASFIPSSLLSLVGAGFAARSRIEQISAD